MYNLLKNSKKIFTGNSAAQPNGVSVTGEYINQDFTSLGSLSNYTTNKPGPDTSSWTLTGGFLRAVRSDVNLGFLNYAKFNGFGFINSKQWSVTVVFDTKQKDANSFGFGFGFMSATGAIPVTATDGFLRADINCSTTANGTTTLRCNGVAAASATLLTQSLNDTILLNITRNNHIITLNAQNITAVATTTPVVTQTTIISRSTSTNWDNSTLVPYMYLLGGTYDVRSLTMSTRLATGADAIFVGDSITHGMFMGSDDKTYPEILAELTGKRIYNFASTSTVTGDWTGATTELVTMAPKRVYFLLGRNDVSLAVAQATTLANYATIIAALTSAGIDYRIISLLPSGSALNTNLTALNTALQAAYPTKYIDIYSYFNGGSGVIKYNLQSGDGTHLSAQGQIEVAKRLAAADPYFQTKP